MNTKTIEDNLKQQQILLQQELHLAESEKQKAEIILLETKIILLENKLRTWQILVFGLGVLSAFLVAFILYLV